MIDSKGELMDAKIESGIRIAKNTAIAAARLNVVAALLIKPSDIFSLSHIIGALLFLVCAYGIAQKSRFCAMAAFFLSIAAAARLCKHVADIGRT